MCCLRFKALPHRPRLYNQRIHLLREQFHGNYGQMAQVASELKSRLGDVDNDYFGLLFLEKEFKLSREDACEQIAYGGNDFGIDGYHVDPQARNFHLLQFKFSKSADQFIGSMQRLLTAGLARVFDVKSQQAARTSRHVCRHERFSLP